MLRGYQRDLLDGCKSGWNQGRHVQMPVCATGSGKTFLMTIAAMEHLATPQRFPGVLGLAHRGTLIAQMSNTFARVGIVHDIIGSQGLIRTIVSEHMENFGRTFYNPRSIVKVGSVDTLPNRHDLRGWLSTVGLGLGDEGHHYLVDNKWGRCYSLVNPDANWMLPTATPNRADKRGCGRHASGIVDDLVKGVSMKWLITNGYLTNFRVRAPDLKDLDLTDVNITAEGEYNQKQLRKAVHRSAKIIGSIVDTYREHTPGKLAICFAVDVEHAEKITAEFNAKGIPAAMMDGTMDEAQRRPIMRKYKSGEIKVLVNVDLFGEGFDLPAVEVVIFARPTASYGFYAQMFGRALRLLIDKPYLEQWDNYTVEQRLHMIARSQKPIAFIHDHVGNIMHFQRLPINEPDWTLDDRKGKSSGPSDAEPIRICVNAICNQPYERALPECPYCETKAPVPAERSLPEHVDGDLLLYTPEMLEAMFGVTSAEEALAIQPNRFCAIPVGVPKAAQLAVTKRFEEKMRQQNRLAEIMPLLMPPTRSQQENMRRFYHRFGVDIVQAKLLGAQETADLNQKIMERLTAARS